MKIPASMMPPITAMVVPKRPRWRARPTLGEDEALGASGDGGVTMLCSALRRRGSTCLGQFEEILNLRERGAVHALHFGIAGFDYVILVGSVGAVAVAETEMSGGQAKRIACEHVAGPGAGETRKNYWVDPILFVNGGGGANDGGVGGRGIGIVAAGHVDVDVAEAFFREMRFEKCERFGGGHVRNEAEVELGDGFAGKNGFAAGSGVAADEAFDIDRRTADEQFERFLEAHIVNPVLDAEEFFRFGFAHAVRGFGDHFLFGVGERADFGGVSL